MYIHVHVHVNGHVPSIEPEQWTLVTHSNVLTPQGLHVLRIYPSWCLRKFMGIRRADLLLGVIH